jgi:hypothetical protein
VQGVLIDQHLNQLKPEITGERIQSQKAIYQLLSNQEQIIEQL